MPSSRLCPTRNPKNLRLGTSRNNKAIVLSDILSDSIKYQDL